MNNAGVASRKGRDLPIWELVREDWEFVFNINVVGLALCCKAALPKMIERRYGRIVNVASIAGKEGNPKMGPYSASKAAVIALTKSLSKELVGKGDICVNSISPGGDPDADPGPAEPGTDQHDAVEDPARADRQAG